MDVYLLWALNTLFQEILDPTLSANDTGFNQLLQNLVTSPNDDSANAWPAPEATATVSPAPVPAPIPETASTSVLQAIQNAALSTGLSPALLKAVATVESGLDPHAVSSAGAVGLMQLMPDTAQGLGVNPNNMAQNALGGAEYLKSLLNQFGQNVSLALAAYNAGPGAVQQYGGIPPYAQTQQYVRDVLAAYHTASNGSPAKPANSSWTG